MLSESRLNMAATHTILVFHEYLILHGFLLNDDK